MRYPRAGKTARNILAVALSSLTAGALLAVPAAATTTPGNLASALLYDYRFAGTTGTVVNSAPDGPPASLKLTGTWSVMPAGVRFSGNTKGDESVGYGKPQTGYTIDEAARSAVGVGAQIEYFKPADGKCFPDTPNITQIGRFGTQTQLKLQLSSCQDNATHVLMECRLAGRSTPGNSLPEISTLPLVNRASYNVSCMKSPDQPNGKTTITLTVTRIETGQTVTNTFTVPNLGTMASTAYISMANKYPLPAPADNTDQFNGIMARAIYCAADSARSVSSCLTHFLPVT